MPEETRAHYDRLAGSYDENWTHSAEFIDWMTGRILRRLDLQPEDRVMDLGCGTGLFTRPLAEHANAIVCVDPSVRMLEQLPRDPVFLPVPASAEAVVAGEVALPFDRFNAILVKEAIHHVSDPAAVVSGLADLLVPGGRLLVVMLPSRIEYPLFQAALTLFEERQPDPANIAEAMRGAGLSVELEYESFPLTFARGRYLAMVGNRYMSLLSAFDDEALERGIAEIRERFPQDPLEFPDQFAFLCGVHQ